MVGSAARRPGSVALVRETRKFSGSNSYPAVGSAPPAAFPVSVPGVRGAHGRMDARTHRFPPGSVLDIGASTGAGHGPLGAKKERKQTSSPWNRHSTTVYWTFPECGSPGCSSSTERPRTGRPTGPRGPHPILASGTDAWTLHAVSLNLFLPQVSSLTWPHLLTTVLQKLEFYQPRLQLGLGAGGCCCKLWSGQVQDERISREM